jgi:hypothetical protein
MADNKTLSKQQRLRGDISTSFIWTLWERAAEDIPGWGKAGRLAKLREFAMAEPILAGALASMQSKAVSLDWQLIGGRNRVRRYQTLLAEAEDGAGWSFLLDRWLNDYLVADIGGYLELGREGETGPVAGLYNLDAETLVKTGKRDTPLLYYPKLVGGSLSANGVPFREIDVAGIVDMPSADESKFGLGYCSVTRALKAARVLMALYRYEDEQLSDMPMPGLVSVTGMTMDELEAAFALYDAKRKSKEQLVFKDVLWLAAQGSALNPVGVNLTSFASLPQGFDKEKTITLYVYTLARDFGVDVREFWPASQTGATKAEAEVQAQKAKGKGFGRMISSVERALNWNVLPEGVEFAFNNKDSEDDLLRENIRGRAVETVRRLWEPAMGGTGIISTDEARRWLVELQAAPEWLWANGDVIVDGAAPLADEEAEMPRSLLAAADQITDARIAEKARRAGLDRGEDLVAINLAGDVTTLWSSRYYSVPHRAAAPIAVEGWPGVEAFSRPFPVCYP